MSNFDNFSYFQTFLSLGVKQGLQKLPKFDINNIRLLFHCYILIPRKCPRKTPFKTQWKGQTMFSKTQIIVRYLQCLKKFLVFFNIFFMIFIIYACKLGILPALLKREAGPYFP